MTIWRGKSQCWKEESGPFSCCFDIPHGRLHLLEDPMNIMAALKQEEAKFQIQMGQTSATVGHGARSNEGSERGYD